MTFLYLSVVCRITKVLFNRFTVSEAIKKQWTVCINRHLLKANASFRKNRKITLMNYFKKIHKIVIF